MVLTLMLAASLGVTSQVGLPPGWRLPSANELTDTARAASPNGFTTVSADLNADGIEDTAALLKSTTHSAEALWVLLSSRDGPAAWIKVDETRWDVPDVGLMMAIEVQQPGAIEYACFDDADECDFGPGQQRQKLKLSSPSLAYFRFGSASSLVFWSPEQNRFRRAWLSD
jgi:hypothetical protein